MTLCIVLLVMGFGAVLAAIPASTERNPPLFFSSGDPPAHIMTKREESYDHPDPEIEPTHSLDVQMTASPAVIDEGLSDTLEVQCVVTGSTSLMSIGIGKTVEGDTCGLTYISAVKPEEVVKMDPLMTGEVSGKLGADGKSGHLAIKWKAPSSKERGSYECIVNTMKSFGQMNTEKRKIKVDVTPLSTQDLVTLVLGNKAQVEKLESALAKERIALGEVRTALAEEKRSMTTIRSALFTKSSVYNGHIYYLSEYSALTFLKVHEVCKNLGGYLAEINDKNEFEFVRGFVSVRMSKRSIVLIAGTDARQEGTWIFDRTSKPVTFFDWRQGDPNNHSGGEHCMALWHYGGVFGMVDYKCHSGLYDWIWRNAFLCEVENPPTTGW